MHLVSVVGQSSIAITRSTHVFRNGGRLATGSAVSRDPHSMLPVTTILRGGLFL